MFSNIHYMYAKGTESSLNVDKIKQQEQHAR